MLNNRSSFISLLLSAILFASCSSLIGPDFEVRDFKALSNYKPGEKLKVLHLDYDKALREGFVIPSISQTPEGYFSFSFSILNNTPEPREYYYKIYYQNESYKFPENDSLAHENFYGSWEETGKTFVKTATVPSDGNFHTVRDSFRIVGNPREESKYFGFSLESVPPEVIDNIKVRIQKDPRWYEAIKEKAAAAEISADRQLHEDAVYIAKEENRSKTSNLRWRRNPRVGKYSFLLVVTTKENLDKTIPEAVKNISLRQNDRFLNPYFYFLYGKGSAAENIHSVVAADTLKVIGRPPLEKGVYVSREDFSRTNERFSDKCFKELCGDGNGLNEKACFKQFIHAIDKRFKLANISEIADMSELTVDDYNRNTERKDLIQTRLKVTSCPCKTISVDTSDKKITVKNPGNSNTGDLRKENVGIIARHGFTYGKFRVKAKLSSLLNKHKVWNGLTNAVWLIYQEDNPWNSRRPCKGKGYVSDRKNGHDAEYKTTDCYSEIDIEISKATRHWPASSYKDKSKAPKESPADSANIMVTCTNWDLACRQPRNFGIGAHTIQYGEQQFTLNRWDHWYKAVTLKTPENSAELFNNSYYYFEIEWKPREIIWRIGPEKNNMRVIGYMNDDITSVPDNQMLLVITQEYHLPDWSPEAPFSQTYIPFSKKDITGDIYEVEIE